MLRRILSVVLATVLVFGCAAALPEEVLLSASAADQTTDHNRAFFTNNHTKQRTKQEIEDYLDSHHINPYYEETYSVEPSSSAPYQIGALSPESIKRATDTLNFVRFVAGLDEISTKEEYNRLAQAATVLNAANRTLGHYQSQPSDMPDDIYEIASSGCTSCNLGWGYWTLSAAILAGWMDDSDTSNRSRVGHRRWCLNPAMKYTGFGFTDGYTAMYAFDKSGPSGNYMVAWPATTMPALTQTLFDSNTVWSFSKSTSFGSNTKVTVTRENDAKQWTFSSTKTDGFFSISNAGYGQHSCVIFRPENIKIIGGDVYTVNITDANFSVTYDVQFYCDHEYLDTYTKKQPTCTEPGEATVECVSCDYAFTKEIPATGHQYIDKVMEPTYTSGGYTEHTCTVCGKSYQDSYTDKLARTSLSKASVTGLKSKYYTGKAIQQTPVVKLGNKTLKAGTDYTVSYKNNTAVGKATVIITGKGAYTGTTKATFKILPKKTNLKSVSSPKAGQLKATYAKVAGVSGYQITYSTSSEFTKAKTKSVNASGTSKTISKLKKGKTYYVKVRTYKTVNDQKYYSGYSTVKKVTIKK